MRVALAAVAALLLTAPAVASAQTERVRVQWSDPGAGLVIALHDDQGRALSPLGCPPGASCPPPIPSAHLESLGPTSVRLVDDMPTSTRRFYAGVCAGIAPATGQVTLTDPDGMVRVVPFSLGLYQEFVAGSTPPGGDQLKAVPPGPGCGFIFTPLPNPAPTANPDSWTVLAGETLHVPPPGVLSNDTDLQGGPLTARVVRISFASSEWSGLAANGSFTYRAGPGTRSVLHKTITYVAVDPQGNVSAPATATVTVVPRICGGPAPAGARWIEGTAGGDTLIGTAATDEVRAGAGPDKVDAVAGNDCVFGQDGDDALRGGPGRDSVSGGAGHDRMDGGGGFDTVDGGPGNDIVIGGADGDLLLGGDGHDVLSDGLGVNRFHAGAGDDIVSARRGEVAELVDCGPGRDIAIVDRADTVSPSCEVVERPIRGRRNLRGGGAMAGIAAVDWPATTGGWRKTSTYTYIAGWDHPSRRYDPLTCHTATREFQPSIVAAVAGIDTSKPIQARRYARIQYRSAVIDPALGTPESQLAATRPKSYRSSNEFFNWWFARAPLLSIGTGLRSAMNVAFVQYRVRWYRDNPLSKDSQLASTGWRTLGSCRYG